MKERPILFDAESVRGILDGRKTQTRRVIKAPGWAMGGDIECDGTVPYWPMAQDSRGDHERVTCPYGQPGDRLWVRETWARIKETAPGDMHYRANANMSDEAWFKEEGWKWRPCIHMPRWASRLLLEVVSVQVERLQDITEADAKAEGIPMSCGSATAVRYYEAWTAGNKRCVSNISARAVFPTRWESIYHTKRGHDWASNPWVWVVAFRRLDPPQKINVDTDGRAE